MVNPNIIWKGSHASRMGIVFDYADNVRENATAAADEAAQEAAENALDEKGAD